MSSVRLLLLSLVFHSFSVLHVSAQTAGKPWKGVPQLIPGRVQCEFYDEGGEGVAYHDSDSVNHGSGHLNPVNGNWLNEFRINEGVDISYTKSNDVDNNKYNFTEPEMNQLYVGWTVPGEWLNYTVTVKQSGLYRIGLMYTCNADGGHSDGAISLSVDGKNKTGPIKRRRLTAIRIRRPGVNGITETRSIPWYKWN